MSRDHARIHLDIWGDDDWLDLPADAQCLYMTIYTSPGRTLCGAHEWNAGKIGQRAADWTKERIEAAAEVLSERLFLIVDADTNECLLRSWIKHDGLWRTPNMAVSVANARANVASRTLRGVIVFELLKLRDAEPESSSWDRAAVQSMLKQKAIDPSLLEPFKSTANPTSNGASKGGPKGGSNPCAKGGVNENPTHGVNGASKGGPTNAITTNANAIEIPPTYFDDETPPRPKTKNGAELARVSFANIPARSVPAHHIAQAFSDSLPEPIESGLLAEIGVVADKCLRDSIAPNAIAAGMRDWALSSSWHPSQIPKFVTKAAARAAHAASGIGKPTLKALDYDTAAEQLIAALEAES
jgi:hypothetical protein